MMKSTVNLLLFVVVLALSFGSCVKEDDFDTSGDLLLQFSSDTILFDTVFTSVGSATQVFKVYNPSKNRIKIGSIKLGKGEQSPYRFNVDGISSLEVNDIEIDGKDSVFVFIKVTVDPNENNAPLIHQDSLIFNINSNTQDVKLIAWGQDAHFYKNVILASDYTFTADKPHVIYNFLIVDSTFTLEIQAGAKIHFHPGAILLVYNSASLKVRGTIDAPVIFEGDRLEDDYKELAGQWDRIWLYAGSIDNEIDYAIIRNGDVGIQADTTGNSTNPTLRITNSQIYNMTSMGIMAQGTNIEAANCVIANCAKYSVALTLGGSYDFRHCTMGNYMPDAHNSSSLLLNNYYIDIDQNEQPRPLTKAYFGNCIIYGTAQEEYTLDKSTSEVDFNYFFDHCLIKTKKAVVDETHFDNSFANLEPWFRDPEIAQYQPDSTLSSVIDRGSIEVINTSLIPINNDLRGKSRINDVAPDLGAYEFEEER